MEEKVQDQDKPGAGYREPSCAPEILRGREKPGSASKCPLTTTLLHLLLSHMRRMVEDSN